jgi:hypothetical protein
MNVDEYVAALMKSNADLRKSNLELDLTIDMLCGTMHLMLATVEAMSAPEDHDKLMAILRQQVEKAFRDSGRLTSAAL